MTLTKTSPRQNNKNKTPKTKNKTKQTENRAKKYGVLNNNNNNNKNILHDPSFQQNSARDHNAKPYCHAINRLLLNLEFCSGSLQLFI